MEAMEARVPAVGADDDMVVEMDADGLTGGDEVLRDDDISI